MDQMNEMMESRGLPTELRVPWLINPGEVQKRLFCLGRSNHKTWNQLINHPKVWTFGF
jgi:hypothetical protein